MLKLWLKHLIYEAAINTLFEKIYKNFPDNVADPLFQLHTVFDELKSEGHIDDFYIARDPSTGNIQLHIEAPYNVRVKIAQQLSSMVS